MSVRACVKTTMDHYGQNADDFPVSTISTNIWLPSFVVGDEQVA